MARIYPAQLETVKSKIEERMNETRALITALEGVKINTAHKALTNKAVEGGEIGDYLGIGKALFVSFSYTRHNGGTAYERHHITAYSYDTPDGAAIGTEGIQRINRTITPAELAESVADAIQYRREYLEKLEADMAGIEQTHARYTALAIEMNALMDSVEGVTAGALQNN